MKTIKEQQEENSKTRTRSYYRVRPRYQGYSPIDFDNIEDAIEEANRRNTIRIDTTTSTKDDTYIYQSDECTILKITEITEFLSMKEISNNKPIWDIK